MPFQSHKIYDTYDLITELFAYVILGQKLPHLANTLHINKLQTSVTQLEMENTKMHPPLLTIVDKLGWYRLPFKLIYVMDY